jgi:hypothetical protein
MFVCCVLSGRGLCDGLITRREESYRLWHVVVCDQETSWTRRPWPALGCRTRENNNNNVLILIYFVIVLCIFRGTRYLSWYSDSLRVGRSGIKSQWRARFSAPVQTEVSVHSASYTVGINQAFPEVNRPGLVADNPPHLALMLRKE